MYVYVGYAMMFSQGLIYWVSNEMRVNILISLWSQKQSLELY